MFRTVAKCQKDQRSSHSENKYTSAALRLNLLTRHWSHSSHPSTEISSRPEQNQCVPNLNFPVKVCLFWRNLCVMTVPRRITHHLKPPGNPAHCACVCACVCKYRDTFMFHAFCVTLFLSSFCESLVVSLLHHLSISSHGPAPRFSLIKAFPANVALFEGGGWGGQALGYWARLPPVPDAVEIKLYSINKL